MTHVLVPPRASTCSVRAPRLTAPAHLPFTIAAVALVTIGAFENRATITVMPLVARDLDGMTLFGAATAIPTATYLIGAALTGFVADRIGPNRPLGFGITAFLVAAILQSLAPNMAVFLVARAVSGAAEAGLDIGLMTLIARALPKDLRARMFSLFATAWVLPSLLGPGVAGSVAGVWGWRVTFLIACIAALPVVPLLRPAMREASERRIRSTGSGSMVSGGRSLRGTLMASSVAAFGVAAIALAGPEIAHPGPRRITGVLAVLAGVGALIAARGPLFPVGVLTAARGAGSVIAVRGLVAASFGLIGAYLPLMLQTVRGMSPATSGLTLTVTGIFWAVGSNISSRDVVQRRTSAAGRTRVGLLFIVVGGSGVAVFVAGYSPFVVALVLWGLAGVGMGLISNSLATAVIDLAPTSELGLHQSAMSTLGVVAQGLALAGGGAAIAITAPNPPPGVFLGIVVAGVLLALMSMPLTRRMSVPAR